MDIVVRAAVVFVFVWLVLRALGKRELGELTAFELVLLFIIGDLVQQSITGKDTSITAAILAISTITLLILAQSYATFRWKRARPILDGTPVVLIHRGRVIAPVLRRQRMTEDDLREAARAQGIADLGHVTFAVLENGGKVSFIKDDAEGSPRGTQHHLA